MTKCECF